MQSSILSSASLHAAPPATYAPKFTAAAISLVAATWHLLKSPKSPQPFFSVSVAIFFLGCGVSACIGATLEAFYDDVQHCVAWNAMIIALEVTAFGAWCAGSYLLGQGCRCSRLSACIGISSGSALFVTSLVVILRAAQQSQFDVAFTFALPGGFLLLAGAFALACRRPRLRTGCGLVMLGVLVTAAGYGLDAAWLGPACEPPPKKSMHSNTTESAAPTAVTAASSDVAVGGPPTSPCPLPPGWTADGIYHISLAVSYVLLGVGTARIHLAERARVLRETATIATSLLVSVQSSVDQTLPLPSALRSTFRSSFK